MGQVDFSWNKNPAREILITVIYPNSRQREMSHEIVAELTQTLRHSRVGAEAIIAGIDQTGCHIYRIVDPGISVCFNTTYFAAVGIGQLHAISQFMLARFEKRWPFVNSLLLTYEAKTRAERIAGVGRQTDMILIRNNGIRPIQPEEMNMLDQVLTDKQSREHEAELVAYQRLRDYIDSITAAASESSAVAPQVNSSTAQGTAQANTAITSAEEQQQAEQADKKE